MVLYPGGIALPSRPNSFVRAERCVTVLILSQQLANKKFNSKKCERDEKFLDNLQALPNN